MPQSFDLPVSLRIRGTIDEIYSAWIKPAIAQKWLCDRMEGEWTPNATVSWWFGNHRQELRITQVETNFALGFQWNAYGTQAETCVTIGFKDLGSEVGITVRESSWELTEDSVKIALDHACGWENTLCRLKAWIEAQVKLR